ncbi:MAG: FadR family transcriptional regulator [Caldisericaceae bacterium]|nr:FadR family transcriptional regulator [Caldisericaceae bacterium]
MVLRKIDPNVPLSKQVEEQIKEAILNKFFQPGERLPSENEMVSTFGVSRTAIREAIHRLAGEGLIKINGRYGAYVSGTEITSIVNPFENLLLLKYGNDSLLYLIQARISFEPEIARLAALYRSNKNLNDLKRCLQKMIDSKDERHIMVKYDINFHRTLAASTNNPIIPIMMEPIYSMLKKFISENFQLTRAPEAAIEEHQKILEYIEKQKEKESYDAMAMHVKTAQEHWYKHHLKKSKTDEESKFSAG